MAYDPADLRLPSWLLSALDAIVRLRLPINSHWHLGLTRPGAVFSATMVGVTGAALYSGNNLLYLCASMLLSMGTLALIMGFLLLRGVPDVSDSMPAISTAGCMHVLRRDIQVRSRFPAILHGRWEGEGLAVDVLIRCAGNALLQGRLSVPRRSLICFSTLWVSTEAPLGLWHLQRRIETDGWTWAAVPASIALPAALETRFPDGGEWQDLRDYARGDAPSRIHWRKSAEQSSSGWLVKRFSGREETGKTHLLRVDLRASPGPAFEHLLARAAGWMRLHPDGRLVLGTRSFNLANAEECLQAWRSLAAAEPGTSPAAGSGGIWLSTGESHVH